MGRYRISALLGTGGMGRVYLGHSPSGRLVAVKVVRPELAEDQGFRRRFAREVAAARRVTAFFTAAVVDADPEGAPPWLATAYVPGIPLDRAIAGHGPWPVDSVRTLGAGLAEALEAIHEVELVHRDLKPANVLIAPDGPRVVDFGISVAAEETALTHTGMIVGTPGFMAPEQLIGDPVTPATDVFTLGSVLTYAATGRGPFGVGSAQSLNFRIAYRDPDLSALPPSGLEAVARCLAKDPAQRPTVAELVEEFGLAAADTGAYRIQSASAPSAWLPDPVANDLAAFTTATSPAPTAPASAPAQPPAQSPKQARPAPPGPVPDPSSPSQFAAIPTVSAGPAPTPAPPTAPPLQHTEPAGQRGPATPSDRTPAFASANQPTASAAPDRRATPGPPAQQTTSVSPATTPRRRYLPFRIAPVALTLGYFLPIIVDAPIGPEITVYTVSVALSVLSCALVGRRVKRGTVPHGLWRVHVVATFQVLGILGLGFLSQFLYFFFAWPFWVVGCGALAYTLAFPPDRAPRSTAPFRKAVGQAPPHHR
ncbi:serine/threonine protein kinase [Streptomyces sp. AJS327]|nr:serine/threonine protein kinase [Streptomyces sp. AJS327]